MLLNVLPRRDKKFLFQPRRQFNVYSTLIQRNFIEMTRLIQPVCAQWEYSISPLVPVFPKGKNWRECIGLGAYLLEIY